jgi:hypothetical protein
VLALSIGLWQVACCAPSSSSVGMHHHILLGPIPFLASYRILGPSFTINSELWTQSQRQAKPECISLLPFPIHCRIFRTLSLLLSAELLHAIVLVFFFLFDLCRSCFLKPLSSVLSVGLVCLFMVLHSHGIFSKKLIVTCMVDISFYSLSFSPPCLLRFSQVIHHFDYISSPFSTSSYFTPRSLFFPPSSGAHLSLFLFLSLFTLASSFPCNDDLITTYILHHR